MRGTQCLFNARRALERVFVLPAKHAEARFVPRQLLPLLHVPSKASSSSCQGGHALISVRTFATGRRVPREKKERPDGPDLRYTTAEAIAKSGRRPPQDHEITDPRIMVIDNGATEGPLSTRFVMTKLEPGESLRMIQPYKPADREAGTPEQYAICKIINRRDEYAREREIKERKRAEQAAGKGVKKVKELEINWVIGEHDLNNKIRQMGGFLDKGMKVELTLGGKKKRGAKPPTKEEAAEVLRKVREAIEAQNHREAKPAEGNVGGQMKLYLEKKQAN